MRIIPDLRISSVIVCVGLALGILASSFGRENLARNDPSQDQRGVISGQTRTVLQDGRVITIGGLLDGKATSSITVGAAGVPKMRGAAATLLTARAWHTATILPDGRILIAGGIGHDGKSLGSMEILDAESMKVVPALQALVEPRAHHTATLITEGSVVFIGGQSSTDNGISSIEIFDPKVGQVATIEAVLHAGRLDHKAVLEPNGRILISEGKDSAARALAYYEELDPWDKKIVARGDAPSVGNGSEELLVAGNFPRAGASQVSLDTLIAIRFSRPVMPGSFSRAEFQLLGPNGVEPSKVVLAEGGMLVFLNPEGPLASGTTYHAQYYADGKRSANALAEFEYSFSTVDPEDQSDIWKPSSDTPNGWRTGYKETSWQSLPPLKAGEGVTAIAGQVLTLEGHPIQGVSLEIDEHRTVTDATGRFLLADLEPGHHELVIDGTASGHSRGNHGVYEAGIEVVGGQTSALPFTIWLPRIDEAHRIRIPSPTVQETVVTTPLIPGLEVHIPPQTVIRGEDGRSVTEISITPIPTDRTPFPLPNNVYVPIYFTIQPGGAYVQNWGWNTSGGVRLVYPNYRHEEPGTRANFWHYDPEGRGWYVYGEGTVSQDGKQVVPDPGVSIYEFTGAMINSGNTPPGFGPPPEPKDPSGVPGAPAIRKGGKPKPPGKDADPVDLSTGLFTLRKTDLFVPDVLPLSFIRTYRAVDSINRPFGRGATHPYAMFLWSANQYQEADLILPDGGRIHYTRISPGTSFTDAVFEHSSTPSVFFKSRLSWNGSGWDLKLKSGLKYVFGDSSPLQAIVDRNGNKITLTHSNGQGGNLTKITSPNGRWIELAYDGNNRITQAKDNLGRTVTYSYDASGRLQTVTDPKGGTTSYTYDTADRMLTIQDPRSIVYLTNQYDSSGRVIQQTQADGSTYAFNYVLDGTGRITQTDITEPRGQIRRVIFDQNGYVTSEVTGLGLPEQQTVSYVRQSGSELLLSVTDSLGRQATYAYDGVGNVTSVTRLAGTSESTSTTMTYEATWGQLATITDPLNHTSTLSYDSMGNLTVVTDALGNHTNVGYNLAGQPVTIQDPMGNTAQFGYEAGDLTSVTDSMGQIQRFVYDGAGRLLRNTSPLGQTTLYEYDAMDKMVHVTDALGGSTTFVRDGNGNITSITDPGGNVTNYSYDSMDRVISKTDALQRVESFQYDYDGNVINATDRRGKVTHLVYDGLERRKFVGFGEVTQGGQTTYESSITYAYDNGDRMTSATDTISGANGFSYDSMDRLTTESSLQGSVSYTYDLAGRRTSMTVSGQQSITYTYDNANRPTGIAQGTSSVGISYDANSRRTSTTLPNGITASYTYDGDSRLTGITYSLGTSQLGDLAYAYDVGGRSTILGGSFARLNLPAAISSGVYDAANQLIQWNGTPISYDLNGNIISDGTNNYTWNARNTLSTVSGNTAASFQYDGLGRRTSKMAGGTSTQYLYDGAAGLQELVSGNPTVNFLPGIGLDEKFSRSDASSTRYLLTDRLGSTIALSDQSGALQTQYTYEPFGRTAVSGQANTNNLQYIGRESDSTGLYYLRARYYSPVLQRFISPDPMGLDGGDLNLYTYSANSPIDLLDPTGTTWRSNPRLFIDWVLERHGKDRFYGPTSPSTQEMMNSFGADVMRADAMARGCNGGMSAGAGGWGTKEAFIDSLLNFEKGTIFQVGGWDYTWQIGPGGSISYSIYNTLGVHSFFLHAPFVIDHPRHSMFNWNLGGSMHQTFSWTEPGACDSDRKK